MTHPFLLPTHDDLPQQSPFTFVSKQLDPQSDSRFRPAAHVAFDSTLRTSGFLVAIPPDELQLLLLVLSFITPNTACHPLLFQLAEALSVSPRKANARLQRLAGFTWRGQPVLRQVEFQNHPAFSPTLALVNYQSMTTDNGSTNDSHAPPLFSQRDRIINHSRTAYTRPRAEVEREIARLNGWPEPPFEVPTNPLSTPSPMQNQHPPNDEFLNDTNEEALVRDQLLRVGLNEEQADSLLDRFDLLRIRRQLSWLNYHRGVRNRAGFLLAAVTDDYEAPLALRVSKPSSDESLEQNPTSPKFESGADLPPLDDSDLNSTRN